MTHSKRLLALLAVGALAGCVGGVEDEWSSSELDKGGDAGPPGERTFAGTVEVKGSNSGKVVKGTYTRNGVVMETTPRQVASEQAHASHYDGPTKFRATYSIVVKGDGTVDRARSTVTFSHVQYTHAGNLVPSGFTTLPIPVTGVTLSNDNPPKLKSFTFAGAAWYANAPNGITDLGITGSVNVEACTATYTAKYKNNSNGAVYTYTVTAPAPVPGCGCLPPTGPARREAPDDDAERRRDEDGGPGCDPDPIPGPPADHELFEPRSERDGER